MTPLSDFATALADPAAPLPPGLACRAGADAATRLAIHRATVTQGWLGSLRGSFPATCGALGEPAFLALSHRFIAQPRSRPALLRQFVDDFPEFLAHTEAAQGRPWLATLARIEQLRIEAFHAPAAPALDADAWQPLLAHPQHLSTLTIGLHPACRWLGDRDGAAARWLAWHHGHAADFDADPSQRTGVLVSRPDEAVEVARIAPSTLVFLDHLRAGAALATALASADAAPVALLRELIARRLASSFSLTPPEPTT